MAACFLQTKIASEMVAKFHRRWAAAFLCLCLPSFSAKWDAKATLSEQHEQRKQAIVDTLHAQTNTVEDAPPTITICSLYYDDPHYLRHQLASWRKYTAAERSRLEFVIIDDGSPRNPANATIDQPSRQLLNLRLYRITEDIPWNIMGAQVWLYR